jgi:hypothetical protein
MCNKLGIQIKSLVVQGTIDEQGESVHPRRPFSNENFVDALVEFIVRDDMVRTHFCVVKC